MICSGFAFFASCSNLRRWFLGWDRSTAIRQWLSGNFFPSPIVGLLQQPTSPKKGGKRKKGGVNRRYLVAASQQLYLGVQKSDKERKEERKGQQCYFSISLSTRKGGGSPLFLDPPKFGSKKFWKYTFSFFSLIGEQNEHFLSSNNVGKFRTLLLYFQQAKGKAPSV